MASTTSALDGSGRSATGLRRTSQVAALSTGSEHSSHSTTTLQQQQHHLMVEEKKGDDYYNNEQHPPHHRSAPPHRQLSSNGHPPTKPQPAHHRKTGGGTTATKNPLLPGSSKKKKSTTFILSWILSLAVAFSLFQTFTYTPPHHADSSLDHHNPGQMFWASDPTKNADSSSSSGAGGGAAAAQNSKLSHETFLERMQHAQRAMTPEELIAQAQQVHALADNNFNLPARPRQSKKMAGIAAQQQQRKGKKDPLAHYDPDAAVGQFTREEILAENQKLHPGEKQPKTKIQQEQQEIFGKDYAQQASILQELEAHRGHYKAPLADMNLELKNKLLPLLGDGDELLSGRRRLVDVLKESHVYGDLSEEEIDKLPQLEHNFDNLYGPPDQGNNSSSSSSTSTHVGGKPIIYGLETCEAYRKMVPWRERFTAPAGMFNTGTNNLEMNLKRNLDYFGRAKYQVPWGKHRMENERGINHAVAVGGLDHTKVLPVVIVRDPYFWMQSMCKTRYAARWAHGPRRCPNLVRTDADKARFRQPIWDSKKLKHPEKGTTTFQVKVRFDVDDIHYYDSMIDLWNEFYRPYWENKKNYPRLIIRFEDMLLHAPVIVDQVAKCLGITNKPRFKYTTNSAKNHGSGTTFLEAVMKTASHEKREARLVLKDKIYAAQHLDAELMEAFHYRFVKG